jgi:hypothetical protein
VSESVIDKALHGKYFQDLFYIIQYKSASEAVMVTTSKGTGLDDIKNDCIVLHFMLSIAVGIKIIHWCWKTSSVVGMNLPRTRIYPCDIFFLFCCDIFSGL